MWTLSRGCWRYHVKSKKCLFSVENGSLWRIWGYRYIKLGLRWWQMQKHFCWKQTAAFSWTIRHQRAVGNYLKCMLSWVYLNKGNLIRNDRNIVLKVSQFVINQVAASGGPLRGPSGWIVCKSRLLKVVICYLTGHCESFSRWKGDRLHFSTGLILF